MGKFFFDGFYSCFILYNFIHFLNSSLFRLCYTPCLDPNGLSMLYCLYSLSYCAMTYSLRSVYVSWYMGKMIINNNNQPVIYTLCPMVYKLYIMHWKVCCMMYVVCCMLFSLCSMPCNICSMLYIICSMLYNPCSMPYSLCFMIHAL